MVQTGPFNEIDNIIAELNTKKKWIHCWKTEQPEADSSSLMPAMDFMRVKKKPPTPFRLNGGVATVKSLLASQEKVVDQEEESK